MAHTYNASTERQRQEDTGISLTSQCRQSVSLGFSERPSFNLAQSRHPILLLLPLNAGLQRCTSMSSLFLKLATSVLLLFHFFAFLLFYLLNFNFYLFSKFSYNVSWSDPSSPHVQIPPEPLITSPLQCHVLLS